MEFCQGGSPMRLSCPRGLHIMANLEQLRPLRSATYSRTITPVRRSSDRVSTQAQSMCTYVYRKVHGRMQVSVRGHLKKLRQDSATKTPARILASSHFRLRGGDRPLDALYQRAISCSTVHGRIRVDTHLPRLAESAGLVRSQRDRGVRVLLMR